MRKANFVVTEWVRYSDVPIPDNVEDKEVIDYLYDQLDRGDLSKYLEDFDLMSDESIYQVIIEKEDGSEYTITN